MGATHDAIEKIGGVIRSLIFAFAGDELDDAPKYVRPDWQTSEDKANAARRLSILRRRLAHCDKMTSVPIIPPAPIAEKKPNDAA